MSSHSSTFPRPPRTPPKKVWRRRSALRGGEKVLVHIGEDAETMPGSGESLERRIRVGEGLPVGKRRGETSRLLRRQGPGETFRDAQGRFREHVAVTAEGLRFDGRLDLR